MSKNEINVEGLFKNKYVKLIEFFLAYPNDEYYVNQILEKIEISPKVLCDGLKELEQLKVLKSEKKANSLHYRLNENNDLVGVLKKMIKPMTYKSAGVDIDAGNEFVKMISTHVKKTFRPEVLTDIGGFGGLFRFNKEKYKNPVLVSGTDGVGTKLKIAFMTGRHDTVGIDLVAMCANDIVVSGAEPLFFLDYLATGKLDIAASEAAVKGIAEGCRQAGCALLGGETAEMPDFYSKGEYDMAGFIVGVVDKDKIIDGKNIKPGDAVIGIASSGVHSNGYSLVRKIFFDKLKLDIHDMVNELGCTVGLELLKPTRVYVKTILNIISKFDIKGIAHITGGGLTENIPRVLPVNVSVRINKDSWKIPEIFSFMQKEANIEDDEMFKTFNMGIGMVLIVNGPEKKEILKEISDSGDKAYIIGEIIEGKKEVIYN